ncbi:hypothetical protein ACJX0J_019311, partial [Zea mays]
VVLFIMLLAADGSVKIPIYSQQAHNAICYWIYKTQHHALCSPIMQIIVNFLSFPESTITLNFELLTLAKSIMFLVVLELKNLSIFSIHLNMRKGGFLGLFSKLIECHVL